MYRQGAFSECAHYVIPYCLGTIFILKFKLKIYWSLYIWNMCTNSYQYIGKSILIFYAGLYVLWVKLKLLSIGRMTVVSCICTELKSILLLIWLYSKFWRLFYHKYFPAVLRNVYIYIYTCDKTIFRIYSTTK
jgi:hypothetical protein